MPVVVGGTNYYLQSLLYNQSIIETSDSSGLSYKKEVSESRHESIEKKLAETLNYILENTDPRYNDPEKIIEFAHENNIHDTLRIVDPDMYQRWHPKDIRKIRRSLEIFYTTGIPHSRHYLNQKHILESSETSLRYPSCIFWIYGKPEKLDPRLDDRVDDMIKKGMFKEMEDMRLKMRTNQVIGADSQYTRGILQVIGLCALI